MLSSVILNSGDAHAACTLCVIGSTLSVTGLTLRDDCSVLEPVTYVGATLAAAVPSVLTLTP